MAYLVSITPRAERDLAHLYEHINAEHSNAALKWYVGLKRAILALEKHPNRCPVTPESAQLRHLLYGRKPNVYRVIYRILRKAEARRNSAHPARPAAGVRWYGTGVKMPGSLGKPNLGRRLEAVLYNSL